MLGLPDFRGRGRNRGIS